MTRRPRQLTLEIPADVEGRALPLPLDTIAFQERCIEAGLTDHAIAALLWLLSWSWQRGPLTTKPAGLRAIARQTPAVFALTWSELRPMFRRRRRGYVLPWLELLRKAVTRAAAASSARAAHAGRVSASKRAARHQETPAAAPAASNIIRPDRFSGVPVSLRALTKLCDEVVFRPFYEAGRQEPPSVEMLKSIASAAPYRFRWREDPAMPDKAFKIVEHRYERDATAWRANDRDFRRSPEGKRINRERRHRLRAAGLA